MSTKQTVPHSGSSRQGPHLLIPSGSDQPLTTTVQISTSTFFDAGGCVTVYVCTNPVLTLYCVALDSGPLVVLSLLSLF